MMVQIQLSNVSADTIIERQCRYKNIEMMVQIQLSNVSADTKIF